MMYDLSVNVLKSDWSYVRKFRHMDSYRKLFSITKLLQIHLTWFQVVYGVCYEHRAATLFDHFSLVFIYIYIYILCLHAALTLQWTQLSLDPVGYHMTVKC